MPSSWERVERVGGRLVLLPWGMLNLKLPLAYPGVLDIILLIISYCYWEFLIRESSEKAAADALAPEMTIESLNAWPAS